MSSEYGELRPTSGWDPLASLGHPCKFQRVSRLCSVTAWHSSSGRQPNFAALNRGRHLYSAGRPSRCALAHISSSISCRFVVQQLYKMHNKSTNRKLSNKSATNPQSAIYIKSITNRTRLEFGLSAWLTKGNDSLESFLSNITVQSDFRKESCVCVRKTFAIFLVSK